jgi:hypothetical protein
MMISLFGCASSHFCTTAARILTQQKWTLFDEVSETTQKFEIYSVAYHKRDGKMTHSITLLKKSTLDRNSSMSLNF